MGEAEKTKRNVCYSLPLIITTPVQCSFGTYFFEMYQLEFGWAEDEYGKIPSLYNVVQLLSFLGLGFLFKWVIDKQGRDQPTDIDDKLNETKWIEFTGVFIHVGKKCFNSATYFLLIYLPIKWHGVKTPYVDSLFSSTSKFWYTIFNGPVSLSNLISNKFLWFITCSVYFPFRMCWTVLYIPMWVFYLIVVNFGAIMWVLSWPFRKAWFGMRWPVRAIRQLRAKNIPEPVPYIKPYNAPKPLAEADPNNILIDYQRLPPRAPFRPKNYPDASSIPDPPVDLDLLKQIWYTAQAQLNVKTKILPVLETLESIPPPTCSACCNTTCCNALLGRLHSAKRFVRTRTFWICFLVFLHGLGMSTFELSDKAIPTYIYNSGVDLGKAINVNTAFFTVTNVIIIFIFSMVKFFSRSKNPFSEAFYLLAILFIILQIPIFPAYFTQTKKLDASPSSGIQGSTLSYVCLSFKWASLTCFHGTVFFFIFTGGPMTTYVAKNILDNHRGIWSFGVMVILVGFGLAQWTHMIIGSTGTGGAFLFRDEVKQGIMGVSILGQIFTYLVFFPHDWSWNKRCWINYLLIALTGAVNTLLVANIYITLDDLVKDVRAKDWKWIFNGCFFAISHVVDSIAIYVVFLFRAMNDVKHITCGCIKFNFRRNFHSVYRKMTILFMLINLFAFGVYVLVHFVDQLLAAAYKLKDPATDFKTKADIFATEADKIPAGSVSGLKGNNVRTAIQQFQNAANAFGYKTGAAEQDESAAKRFQEFATALMGNICQQKLLTTSLNRDYVTRAKNFVTDAKSFKDAADTFVTSAKEFNTAPNDTNLHTKFQEAANTFGTVGTTFEAVGTSFQSLGTKLNSRCTELQNRAQLFQSKATEFKNSADSGSTGFKQKALLVNASQQNDKDDLNSIKTSFLTAANSFGEAANAFNDAAQAFSGIL